MAATSETGTWTSERLSASARDHLWMHFTRHGDGAASNVPVIVRGEGAYVWDVDGRRGRTGGVLRGRRRPRPRGTRRSGREAVP
jgi:hypothetical protein